MAAGSRKPVLDEMKTAEVLAILSVGCSRRTAARYVGCDPKTIQNTADRDPDFAEKVRRAQHGQEVACLKRIEQAARKEQYWRAAAWVLERKFPDDYGRRGPDVITLEQIKELLAEFAEIIIEEVPVPDYRQNVLKRFDSLFARLEDACHKKERRR